MCLFEPVGLLLVTCKGSEIADRVNGEQAAPAVSGGLLQVSESHVSDESESIFHEEVTRETTIDARVTTQTTTTKSHTDATKNETIDAVRIDTSVSYVHASVQHDKEEVDGTLHLGDHPTFSIHPADKLPGLPVLEEERLPVTQPPLGPTFSTGYAALARFLEDEEENVDEDAAVNDWLADSSRQDVTWKQVEPLQSVTEVVQDNGEEVSMIFLDSSEGAGEEITASGGVTKVKVPTVLADSIKQEIRQELAPSEDVTEVKVRPVLPDSVKQEIGQDLARGDFERTQAQMSDLREDQEEDRICCLPSSKWRWGGPKLSSEGARSIWPGLVIPGFIAFAGVIFRKHIV